MDIPTRNGQYRDRIIDFRRVRAGDLLPDPRNARRHTPSQRAALLGVLSAIGITDALLARETPDGLMLVDGHLRSSLDPEMAVPVLVLDLDDTEAAQSLATHDPIGAMAQTDTDALMRLLASVTFEDDAVNRMLEALANGERHPLPDPSAEWAGMPEFEQEDVTGFKCIVHFETQEDMAAFEALVGQHIPTNTKAIWYPRKKWADMKSTVYRSAEAS
jgi:hypothetical protein